MLISNAKVTVLAAALAAAGAILNSTDAPPIIAILWTVACLIGVCRLTVKRKIATNHTFSSNTPITPITPVTPSSPITPSTPSTPSTQRTSPIAVATALLLAVSTLGYFEYAQIRKTPKPNDLAKFSGQDVIFIATTNRQDCREATRELTLNCETLLFPEMHPLSGKTDLAFPKPPEQLAKIGSATNLPEQVRLRIRGHVYQPRINPQPWEYDKQKKLAALGIYSICNLERQESTQAKALMIEEHPQPNAESGAARAAGLDLIEDLATRYELSMCTIMLLTKSGQRSTLVLPALSAAFLLTVTADPLCTNDLGLQLSYAATVGIILGSRALATQFYAGKSKWKRSLADAIAVVLIAQFSVMPIQLFFFWRAGTMFIPANLLVTPLVTPLTMVGFASSTLALGTIPQPAIQAALSSIIAMADAIAFIPLTMMVLLVNAFSSCDAANFSLGPPSVLSVVLYYSCFLVFILSLQIRTKIAWTTMAFIGTLILLLWRPAPPLLTVANVHAHTILINSNHQAIDIDCRDKPSKIMERFFAFNGAKFCPSSFSTGQLKSGVRYVHSQDWLLVIHSDKWQPHFDSESAEILLTARKLQCDQIIVLIPQFSPQTDFLPTSEFAPVPQSKDSELKLIGMKNAAGLLYTKTMSRTHKCDI
ncbi:MAG: ComEC/Rec2 family competence protein [Candidatus Melainabacteria bacterium]|nr:ComEC/Rec2 family competence protein [Candidatus Melainabacteria bacterium]